MTLRFYTDYRLGGVPRQYLASEEDKMLIPDEVRKCVVFLLYIDRVKQRKVLAGTAFLVGVEQDDIRFTYTVTAKHVIVGAKRNSADNKIYMRMNDKQGGRQDVETNLDDWLDHPTDTSVDVSVLNGAPPLDIFDGLVLDTSAFAIGDLMKMHPVRVGDDVFITGLFSNHHGRNRNIPILRVGNIAALPEEKVNVKGFGDIEAYLIEARSIGGLSGSPVFLHRGGSSATNLDYWHAGQSGFSLLGLIHGHWDIDENAVDELAQDINKVGQVNMGIAIVVPATKIIEIINRSEWIEERQIKVAGEKKKKLPTQDTNLPVQDSAESEEKDNEGITKEEFEDALRKIARPLKPDEKAKKGKAE
jgi:hypothetical protein